MKFLKPVLIFLTVIALTYTVSARKVSFNRLATKLTVTNDQHKPNASLPVNGDLLFAFTTIASLGGYMVFKK